jgi:hypothetical protein
MSSEWPPSPYVCGVKSLDAHEPMDVMDIDAEILARVRAAKAWDPSTRLEDFQIRATADGYILTNLKVGYSEFIFDESSSLDDLTQVFPGIVSCGFASDARETGKSSGNIITI